MSIRATENPISTSGRVVENWRGKLRVRVRTRGRSRVLVEQYKCFENEYEMDNTPLSNTHIEGPNGFTEPAQDIIVVLFVVSLFRCSIPFSQFSSKVSTWSISWDVGVAFLCM